MTFVVVWFAVSGVLLGGALSFYRQRKPWWVVILLAALAAAAAWFAFVNIEAAQG